ncbi:serine hydrolase domain-containing protein [Actinophytocola algeriensis]|uniref:D-alanyl-D-alanine carboxypeptidase n=1 Tax=Actinophytocola algeriensis TaxID=1768010 RepID=A0A7W7VJA2_9PSEU|nr:serine hydrolase domain-containing protein [Actinophytocola algeriensis]MBB4912432.1 D-alanyl-D-alanine carboxypeptidase [Actinophytocola algeriensis]MBE1480995.1 D-alanyl-D-alanine carboxypeptidase [Actinophytocola algeriensis]
MLTRKSTRVVAGSLALALGCVAAVPAAATPRGGHPGDHADVQAVIDGFTAAGAPGAMVYGQDRRGRWSVSSGTAELGTDRPIRPRDRVRVASNTKMFTAAVVLQLVEEREVELDAPIEEYVPGLVHGNGYDGTKITVRQLLQHTSGMADYVADVLADPDANNHPWRPEELVAIGLSHPPLFAPGAAWAYSNTGYIVLGMIVEEVTGNDLGAEVTDRLIRPLGLGGTTYPEAGDKRIRGPHAHGYFAFPGQPVMDITELEPSLPGAAGSLVSTGPDLTRFVRALLSGKVLRPDLLRQMRTTVPARGYDYGLGIGEISLPCGGSAWGHAGNLPGFDTFTAATEDGRAVFVVTNGRLADGSAANSRAAAEAALC